MHRRIILVIFYLTAYSVMFSQGRVGTGDPSPRRSPWEISKVAIPVVLVGLGIWGTTDNNFINQNEIREERFEYFPGFTNKADNYFQIAPIVLTYAFDIAGMASKNSWKRQTLLLAGSQLFMSGMIYPLKKYTAKVRPDSSSANSFPSGHTAQAFLAATFFRKEYGKRYPWMSVGMYALSTGIGVMRILNNKHWVSDVLAGAGMGMLSVELSYFLDKIYRKKIMKVPVTIIPVYQQEQAGFTMRLFL